MSIIYAAQELPSKIVDHVNTNTMQHFIAGFKTCIKPNDTIPTLWLLIHEEGLLFCSTHKTRGLFKVILVDEIDSFAIHVSSTREEAVMIIFKSMHLDDLYIKLPSGVTVSALLPIIQRLGIQILSR